LLTEGVLVDLPYALLAAQAPAAVLPTYVWLGPHAPADAVTLLTQAGLRVEGSESVAQRRAELDRDGTALALEIFIVAAFAAVVLAGGALLASTTAAARRRSYELAALRVLGARDRILVRAGRREQLALTFVGLGLGVGSGLLGAWLAIPALPAVDGTGVLLQPHRGPAWLAVGVVALVFLVIGWAVAPAAASRTVRLARLERLREAEA
jgi:predicted lysophospholipase L1 biosynthesis ABC-type transport system permease subunit